MTDAQKHIDAIRAALTMGPDGLRPCPWCGNPDVATNVIEGSTDRWRCMTGCCTAGPEVRREAGPDAAVAAWNDRKINESLHAILAHIDAQAAEIERLRALHREMAEDTERLNWLNANHGSGVFCVGSRWYTRRSYGMPWRRRADLRDAIDAARKEADRG